MNLNWDKYDAAYQVWKEYKKKHIDRHEALKTIGDKYEVRSFFLLYPLYKTVKPFRKLKRFLVRKLSRKKKGNLEEKIARIDFDADWYLKRYPDVAAGGMDPLVHYVTFGRAEGRLGCPPAPAASPDTDTMLKQIISILRHEQDIPAPPPKHLQVRVIGAYVSHFIDQGFENCHDLNCVLEVVGKQLKDFNLILDFGCGCGRTIRALRKVSPSSTAVGMDIDGEAIEWLSRNYARFGKFLTCPHYPPTALDDHQFDLIYGISVFTHLPEDMQFLWLKELSRVSKPHGYLILTTHGEKHYMQRDSEVLSIMENKGFFYSDFGFNYGRSISLPDFYQVAFHSHKYIRKEWNRYFDIIDIQTLRMSNHQDTVLLQNRG